jgi:hypothetical protein
VIDFSDCLGEEEVAEHDHKSGQPVVWGKRLMRHLVQRDFEHLKLWNEVITVMEMDTVYFVVTKRLSWEQLIAKHGQPVQVGTGPRGGFKWVRMTDDTYWAHKQFREESLRWLKSYPRFRVKCDKAGNSQQPARRTIGRKGKRK